MILVVSGWRDWTDAAFVVHHMRRYVWRFQGDLHVRVGDSRGVDAFVRALLLPSNPHNVTCAEYRANWDSPGRSGGPIRNGQMLRGESQFGDPTAGRVADRLLAFPQPFVRWRSPGSGTVGCMLDAFQLGIDLDVPGYRPGWEGQ